MVHKKQCPVSECYYCSRAVNGKVVIHMACVKDFLKKNGFVFVGNALVQLNYLTKELKTQSIKVFNWDPPLIFDK